VEKLEKDKEETNRSSKDANFNQQSSSWCFIIKPMQDQNSWSNPLHVSLGARLRLKIRGFRRKRKLVSERV
jgi:hypothetical protein